MSDVQVLTGRRWRSFIDDIVAMERDAMGGLGPYEQDWIVTRRSPERVRQLLERARARPDLVCSNSPYAGVVGQPSSNPTSFGANSTNVETNLWTPAIWTPIPANTMQTGQLYTGQAGGIFSTSSAAPTSTWTPRCGQSATPGSNVTLGATTGTTMIASLSNVPWFWNFTLAIRALGLAASGASGTGNGFVCIGGLTTAAGIIQSMGATVASTLDNTAATGLVLSQAYGTNQASNTLQCQWVAPVRSFN